MKARAPSSVNRPPGPESHAWLYTINTPHSPGPLSRSRECPAHAHSNPKFSYLYSSKPHHLFIPRAMMVQVSIMCHQTHSTILLPQLSAPRLTLSGSQGVCSLPRHRGSWSFLSRGLTLIALGVEGPLAAPGRTFRDPSPVGTGCSSLLSLCHPTG